MFSLSSKSASAKPSAVQFVTAVTGTALTTGGVTSVTFTGHQAGDLLLAIGGGQGFTFPTYTSGWTFIVRNTYNQGGSGSVVRTATAVYKIASSSASETITFTSTGTSASSYSSGIVFRNASGVGASSSNDTTTFGATFPVNALTLQKTDGTSAICCGVYINTSVSSYNNSIVRSSGGIGYRLGVTSFSGGTGTWASSNPNNSLSVEIIK